MKHCRECTDKKDKAIVGELPVMVVCGRDKKIKAANQYCDVACVTEVVNG